MRIAVISDIHGNYYALLSVLKKIKKIGVDFIYSLGDIVGYGPHPNECIELIKEHNVKSILGNHDLAVLNLISYNNYNEDAIYAINWTKEVLKPENKDYLLKLSMEDTLYPAHFIHGVPPDPLEFRYLFNIFQAKNILAIYDEIEKITFIGHSHLTKSFYFNMRNIIEITSNEINTSNRGKFICTVGSVGQPRDNDPRSCLVIFDYNTGIVKYHRVVYPIEKTIKEIKHKKLPAFLGNRLRYGV